MGQVTPLNACKVPWTLLSEHLPWLLSCTCHLNCKLDEGRGHIRHTPTASCLTRHLAHQVSSRDICCRCEGGNATHLHDSAYFLSKKRTRSAFHHPPHWRVEGRGQDGNPEERLTMDLGEWTLPNFSPWGGGQGRQRWSINKHFLVW